MRSNLMAALGVGMFLAVVFVVTLVSQFSGGPAPEDVRTADGAAESGVPLEFVKTEMSYEPGSDDLDKKYFQGFFEVTDRPVLVNFWFKNIHRQPVTLAVRGRSCTACTSANVAVIDPAAMKRFQSQTAFARLGVGAAPVPDLLTPLAHLALLDSLKWQPLEFPPAGRDAGGRRHRPRRRRRRLADVGGFPGRHQSHRRRPEGPRGRGRHDSRHCPDRPAGV